jgi:regulator of cell morphogenesis and NO signaling
MDTAPITTTLEMRTIGEIAAALPGASAVFRQFRLDYCCGGNVLLPEAAAKRGVSFDVLQAALAELDMPDDAPLPEEAGALIDHVLSRYHETHRRDLPELIRLACKVEKVHGDHVDAPHGLGQALLDMQAELETHMQKEEAVLFPLMRLGGRPGIAHPISQMRHEHDQHAAHIRQLETLTDHFRLPDGACRSWQALYLGLAQFVDDLMEHIHIENNILFARFAPPQDALQAGAVAPHSSCCGSCS